MRSVDYMSATETPLSTSSITELSSSSNDANEIITLLVVRPLNAIYHMRLSSCCFVHDITFTVLALTNSLFEFLLASHSCVIENN